MTPCNDVDKTEAQEFVDELTVLGNVVRSIFTVGVYVWLIGPVLYVIKR